jgi:hypothetical protein
VGKTVKTLAELATEGKIFGIDHSKDCMAVASRINRKFIDATQIKSLLTFS